MRTTWGSITTKAKLPRYSPTEEANNLGIPIVYGHPGEGRLGRWDGTRIIIRPNQTARVERSVICHELIHAIFDEPHFPAVLSPRIEARCDRMAAEKLIDSDELRELAQAYPDDPGRVAYELGVTDRILEAYLKAHPEQCFIASAA